MVKRPRCQNSVDERQRATCPICFAPLPSSHAQPGSTAPGYTPLPPSAVASPAPRSPQAAAPYAPPPGSPYTPPPPTGYSPPPGAPYHFPPLPGAAPSPGVPSSVPGYAPTTYTRTTLTGEVVETTPPPPVSTPPYAQGGYTTPPVATPYGNRGYGQPAPPASNKFWSALNWRVAGGGGVAVLYIGFRLLLIVLRVMHPMHSYTPADDYRTMPLQYSYPTTPQIDSSSTAQPPTTYPYTPPNLPQPRIYTPPNLPNPPNFPSHFHRPNMPGMPNLPAPSAGFPGQ